MSTTYGDRPLRVTFTSNDSSGVAEFLMAQRLVLLVLQFLDFLQQKETI